MFAPNKMPFNPIRIPWNVPKILSNPYKNPSISRPGGRGHAIRSDGHGHLQDQGQGDGHGSDENGEGRQQGALEGHQSTETFYLKLDERPPIQWSSSSFK